jgi:hypothetical protein
MEDSQPAPDPALAGVSGAGGNGRRGEPVQPMNRSALLRRTSRFPFEMNPGTNGIRIRRERRVSDSFSGIASLARVPGQDSGSSSAD